MLISINQLSEITGVDRRTIKKRLGDLEYEKSGRSHLYRSEDALPAIYRIGTEETGIYDLTLERARLAHHQANCEALKESQLRGELVPVEILVEFTSAMHAAARSKLLAVHSKIRGRFPSLPSAALDEIQRLHHEALSELGTQGIPASVKRMIHHRLPDGDAEDREART